MVGADADEKVLAEELEAVARSLAAEKATVALAAEEAERAHDGLAGELAAAKLALALGSDDARLESNARATDAWRPAASRPRRYDCPEKRSDRRRFGG